MACETNSWPPAIKKYTASTMMMLFNFLYWHCCQPSLCPSFSSSSLSSLYSSPQLSPDALLQSNFWNLFLVPTLGVKIHYSHLKLHKQWWDTIKAKVHPFLLLYSPSWPARRDTNKQRWNVAPNYCSSLVFSVCLLNSMCINKKTMLEWNLWHLPKKLLQARVLSFSALSFFHFCTIIDCGKS